FWGCLTCYQDQIDLEVWDPQTFAAALDERIVAPGQHALDMLTDASYLTRLYTVISPHEMIDDPLFHETDGLGTVDSSISATRINDCDDGPTVIELPDGRSVALDDLGSMPDLGLPAAERIEQIPMMGPPQVEVDNRPDIDAAIDAWNAGRLDGPGPSCSVDRAGRFGAEGALTMLTVFGIAFMHRRRRTNHCLSRTNYNRDLP